MNPLISLVIPVYNEEAAIRPVVESLVRVMDGDLKCGFEMIIVNDGSLDGTSRILFELATRDPRIRVLSFRKNLGHQKALVAGLDCAAGDAVVMLDGDGQHPPPVMAEMVRMWMNNNELHVIQAIREGSQGSAQKNITSAFYYRAMQWLCPECEIVPGMSDFRLLSREAVLFIRQYRDRHRNLRLLVSSLPMTCVYLRYPAAKRMAGGSQFTLSKMIHLATDGLFAYSKLPLRLSLLFTLVTGLFSLAFFSYAIAMKISGQTVTGWASMICLVTLLFTGLFGVLSIFAEYLARIYEDVKARPLYWVDEFKPDEKSGSRRDPQ